VQILSQQGLAATFNGLLSGMVCLAAIAQDVQFSDTLGAVVRAAFLGLMFLLRSSTSLHTACCVAASLGTHCDAGTAADAQ
jgi:hypothetical protein